MEQNLETRNEDAPEVATEAATGAENWHLDLENALRPFPRFVTDVHSALTELELHQAQWIEGYEARIQELQAQIAAIPKKTNASPAKTSAKALEQRRVLLVDDAELPRVLMSHYFKGLPVKVDFAVSLEEAIRCCAEKKYDLLIVDLELKGTVAEDLAGALKSHGRLMALGSGESIQTEQAMALQTGFELYLSRSSSKEAMVEGLSAALWGSH